MPALVKTRHVATITWLGRVPHRDAADIVGEVREVMPLGFDGFAEEVHAGVTRASCSRVTTQHPKGTTIRNVRQLSIVSAEELAVIAARLDLDRIDPAWLGASVVVQGIADFTHLPPSARLQGPDGVTLVVDMLNQPCTLVSRTIELARPGHGKAFKAAAKGLRGVTAWVERPGTLHMGDSLVLHVPGQRPWMADAATADQADLF
ncbi:MOSC domain-containing protein [Loktanella fryxellensis]|uniref:MOSC domain-containing protein n=1 Tax=Loktanella fryxellensis TaxID=245187 RepID=A0A1H8G179_9RHOB|nr:MOSC domain-containing protein [Loktanella fryxellensis]SEN37534.1 MOSC domain-containing protein [Loktanella fryxellensis]